MLKFLEQFERVKRFYEKLKNYELEQLEYEDNFWSFFQNSWHLKDWIKNDENVLLSNQDVEDICKNYNSLMICADLANRSKHLKFTRSRPPRKNADLKSIGVTIYVPTLYINLSSNSKTQIRDELNPKLTGVKYHYEFIDDSGNKYQLLNLSQQIINDWNKIIIEHIMKNVKQL